MTTMEQQRNLKIVQQFHLLDNINTEFNVYEEGGNEVYKIAGKTNSYDTSKSLAMTDASGKVLAYIDQSTMQGQAERITGQTTLHILSADKNTVLATISTKDNLKIPFVQKKLTLVMEDKTYDVSGGRMSHDFKVEKDGKSCAIITKEWFYNTLIHAGHMMDTYNIKIQDKNDEVVMVCTAVILELLYHTDKKSGGGANKYGR